MKEEEKYIEHVVCMDDLETDLEVMLDDVRTAKKRMAKLGEEYQQCEICMNLFKRNAPAAEIPERFEGSPFCEHCCHQFERDENRALFEEIVAVLPMGRLRRKVKDVIEWTDARNKIERDRAKELKVSATTLPAIDPELH